MYARFEDVPESAYQALLRPHYGDIETAIFAHNVTIGGIPCAAGEIKLHHNAADGRCWESDERTAAACGRVLLREYQSWKQKNGVVSDGYVISSCVLAKDLTIDSERIPASTRISLRPNGTLEP